MQLCIEEQSGKRRSRLHLKRNPLLIQPSYKPELLWMPIGYKMSPSPQFIFNNNFIAEDLCIQNRWAKVEWKGIVDLSSLQQTLSETIDFGQHFVQVYRNDCGKPSYGKELNKRCIATLYNSKKLKSRMLNTICIGNGTKLLAVNRVQRVFKIQIPHFTKFSYDSKGDETLSDSDSQQEIAAQKIVLARGFKKDLGVAKNILGSVLVNLADNRNSIKHLGFQRARNIEEPIPVPKDILLYDVDTHNQTINKYQNQHTCELMFSANHRAFRFFKEHNHYTVQELQRHHDSQFSELSSFLDCLRGGNEQFEELIVQSDKISMKIKRVISLIQILFEFTNTKLHFHKIHNQNQTTITLKRGQGCHRQNEFERCLKDWIEWVTRSSRISPPSGTISNHLALRRASALANQFQAENQGLDNAQFVACIEDEVYRFDIAEKQLIPELANIDMENAQSLPEMHWLFELGIQVWYFIKTSLHLRISSVLFRHYQQVQSYHEQFRVFQIFQTMVGQPSSPLPLDQHEQNLEELLCLFYISCRLGQYERKHYKGCAYAKYRYRLVRSILGRIKSVENMVAIMQAQNYLELSIKNQLLKQALMKMPEDCNKLLTLQWSHKENIVDEVLGCEHLNRFEFHRALQRFIRIPQEFRSSQIRTKVIQIAHMNELVFNYKRDLLQRHLKLLDRCQYPQLNQVKVIINLRLGIAPVDSHSITTLCDYAGNLEPLQTMTLMSLMLPILQKNRILASILAEDVLIDLIQSIIYKSLLKLYKGNKMGIQSLKKSYLTYKYERLAEKERQPVSQQTIHSRRSRKM